MSAESINIRYTAELARLALSPEEIAKFDSQLGSVIGHMEQLQKLDLTGIEPTAHASPVHNIWRQDEVKPSLPVEEALRNAPQQANNLLIMPKIVE